MSLNILINEIVGIIPGVGDVFSFWFKSNKRNYELLVAHTEKPRRARISDWFFVIATLALLFVIVATGILVSFLVLRAVAQLLGLHLYRNDYWRDDRRVVPNISGRDNARPSRFYLGKY